MRRGIGRTPNKRLSGKNGSSVPMLLTRTNLFTSDLLATSTRFATPCTPVNSCLFLITHDDCFVLVFQRRNITLSNTWQFVALKQGFAPVNTRWLSYHRTAMQHAGVWLQSVWHADLIVHIERPERIQSRPGSQSRDDYI
jgi:hypothetical protein